MDFGRRANLRKFLFLQIGIWGEDRRTQ